MPSTSAQSDDLSIHELIKDYIAKKPDFTQHINPRLLTDEKPEDLELKVKDLNLIYEEKKEREREAFVRSLSTGIRKMPHHPAEENVSGNITDQVAKDSSDSTASTHPHHQEGTGATSGGSLSAMAHKAAPGPVMAENIGKPASKEELKARAEELNK